MAKSKKKSLSIVSSEELRELTEAVFRGRGVPEADAELVADILVEANLRGHDSHGVIRIPKWVVGLDCGALKAECSPIVIREKGATAMIFGDRGLGPVVGRQATDMVLQKAKEFGIGLVSVRKASHIGILQYYSQWLAENGVIGIVMTNTESGVAPFGSRQSILGTNPLTISVPSAGEPYLVDMSTSVVARGKIVNALERGESIPEGWAVDKDGKPTTDPAAALAGALLPAGGPKGSGLAIMIDLLTGALAGGSVGTAVGGTMNIDQEITKGDMFLAIDPGAVGPLERFVEQVEALALEIHDSSPAPGVKKVLMPGEFERVAKKDRSKNGIAVPNDLLAQIKKLAK
ncbi:MAG TPA: sulfolactate dehydrogenase [Rhodospirillaceae bacterium]|nr:sulfolactate dehydrogenase [Rhodospirillaceae bacterium]